ncbi:hypothetical protein D6C79_05452 [Aureobasidium pullulans]|nr:hypothetical protein D6C79_05452 [Aureobasidium pullulans]
MLDTTTHPHARSRLSRSRNHHQASAERQQSYHLSRGVQPTLYNHPCLHVFPTNRRLLARQGNPFNFSQKSPCPPFALLYQGLVEFGDVDIILLGLQVFASYIHDFPKTQIPAYLPLHCYYPRMVMSSQWVLIRLHREVI